MLQVAMPLTLSSDTLFYRGCVFFQPQPQKSDQWGQTPLWIAAWWCRPTIVDKLLEAGADHRIADSRGRTPLMVRGRRRES